MTDPAGRLDAEHSGYQAGYRDLPGIRPLGRRHQDLGLAGGDSGMAAGRRRVVEDVVGQARILFQRVTEPIQDLWIFGFAAELLQPRLPAAVRGQQFLASGREIADVTRRAVWFVAYDIPAAVPAISGRALFPAELLIQAVPPVAILFRG